MKRSDAGAVGPFFDAYRAQTPMAIDLGGNHRRLAAAIVIADCGIAFADFGWDEPGCSFHPFHVVEGCFDPAGRGPWQINSKVSVCLLTERDPELAEWQRVFEYYGARFSAFRATGESRLTEFLANWS